MPRETLQKQGIGTYRWTICALLFFATTVNYLDRQVLSLLAPDLSREFGWSNTDYANITATFQFVYAIAMLFAGRMVDKLGTKAAFTLAIVVWSIGAVMHAAAMPLGAGVASLMSTVGLAAVPVSIAGFMLARAMLALGEAGNFPAAIKATAEYFPKKDRAFATGIFNSGANVGAILAPLSVPLIARYWGWQAAFVIIGAIGFVWLGLWQVFYARPESIAKPGAPGPGAACGPRPPQHRLSKCSRWAQDGAQVVAGAHVRHGSRQLQRGNGHEETGDQKNGNADADSSRR